MIKVVSFDIGNTIYKFENKINKISEKFNIDYEIVYKNYKEIFQRSNKELTDKIKLFCNKVGISNSYYSFFYDLFNNNDKGVLIFSDTYDVLKKIKDRNIKIILFSNSHKDNTNRLDPKLLSLIDKIYFSCNIGHSKEEEESFNYIIDDLKIKPNEIVHIGDSYNNDYLMPKKMGWNAILINNQHQDSISEFNEILNIISKFN